MPDRGHVRRSWESPASRPGARAGREAAVVYLYWLPLGAGGHCVRINGRVFEAVSARAHRRKPQDLYHSALEVRLEGNRYAIEMAPVWHEPANERGVVAEGAVGSQWVGRLRLFRYEIRCWRDGRIPDIDEAVESPLELTRDPDRARRLLSLVAAVPTPVWGRDDLGAGDMWNSNSLVSWLITRSGIATPSRGVLPGIHPPTGGRAPGWAAGIAVAARQQTLSTDQIEPRRHTPEPTNA